MKEDVLILIHFQVHTTALYGPASYTKKIINQKKKVTKNCKLYKCDHIIPPKAGGWEWVTSVEAI